MNILEPRLAPTVTFSVSNPTPFPKLDSSQFNLLGAFVVTRSGDLGPAVQVNYTTQDGTAHAGTDYQATSGTLSFAPNQTMATVNVPILGNNIFQADKTFTLTLSSPLVNATFAPPVDFATQNGPGAVAVADFIGNGKPDLLVTNSRSNTVSVLLNSTPPGATTPSFPVNETFPVGNNPGSVAVADFNGGGKPGFAVGNYLDNTVSVALNSTLQGATLPSFFVPVTFAVGGHPSSVAVGDFNGDGKPDLAIATADSRMVTVLLNTTPAGATVASFTPGGTFATGPDPEAVAAADFNGDGKPDLAVVNYSDGTLSVLLNTTLPGASVASFTPQTTFPMGVYPRGLAVGDLNGDGKPDIIVPATYQGQSVVALVNTTPPGATRPSFSVQGPWATGHGPFAVAVADFNGDGRPDLVIANANIFGPGSVSLLLNETTPGATSLSFAPQRAFPSGAVPEAVAVGDFNGDGNPDFAVANFGSNAVSVVLNTRAPSTAPPGFTTLRSFGTGHYPNAVAVADFNGDGKPDLVIANQLTNTVSVLLNTTPPGATAPTFTLQQTFAVGSSPDAVVVADVNGDGRADLAVANYGSNTVSVLLNTTPAGATAPTFAPQRTFAVGAGPRALVATDFNSDYKPDLAVANRFANTVSVLLNTTPAGATAPSFAPQATFAAGNGPVAIAVGDLNGDGQRDLVVATVNAGVSVLLNYTVPGVTTPAFFTQQTFAVAGNPQSVAVGDLNGDGKPDLVVGTTSQGVAVLLNTTPPGRTTFSFTPPRTFATGSTAPAVVIGDLSGDGKPDLAVANYSTSTLGVLLNQTAPGSTTAAFAAQQTFAAGARPTRLAEGDFNGDGLPDLALPNITAGTVSVLLHDAPVALGGPATGTISSAPEAPRSVTVAAGNNQSTRVATAFPAALAVDVRDANGTLVQNVSVSFIAPGNGPSGTFTTGRTATVVTNASGRATTSSFEANTVAGRYTVTAQASGGSNPSTGFSLTNTPGAPVVLSASAGSNQRAVVNTAFGTSLLASVIDQFDNPVPGVTITFTAPTSGAGATFAGGNSGTTDANGQVSKAITANTVAGTYSITAAVSGSNLTNTFVNLTNTAGAPGVVTATAGSNQGAVVNTTFATNLLATVTDPFGNRLPNVLVVFNAPSSGASASFPSGYTGTTDANGQVSKAIIANSLTGIYNITATAAGGSNPTTAFVNLSNTPAAVDHVAVTTTAANPDVAGTPFAVTVTAQDAYNNTVTGYTGMVHFSSQDPYGATLPPDYTFQPGDHGTATFPGGATLYTAGIWDVTATDTSNPAVTGSANVTVTAATLDHFSVTTSVDGGSTVAGTPFDASVTAQDAFNNTVTGYTGTVTFSSQDPYGASLPPNYTFQPSDMGSVTFGGGATLYAAGTWDVTVTDTGASGTDNVTVTPAALDHFLVTTSVDGGSTVAGSPFDVTITAQDPYHNTVTSYTGTVHFSSQDPYGATLPADYTFTASNMGDVTFGGGATLYTAGVWDVTVTDTGTGASGTDNVTVTPAAAVQFQLSAPAAVAPNTPFDVTVTALDPYGNVDVNYQGTVTFSTSDPDPEVVLPADYTFTAADAGVHTLAGGFTLVTEGDQVLTATDTANGITGSATVTVQPMDASVAHGRGGVAAWAAPSSGQATAPAGSAAERQRPRLDHRPGVPGGGDPAPGRLARPVARLPHTLAAWRDVLDQLFSEGDLID